MYISYIIYNDYIPYLIIYNNNKEEREIHHPPLYFHCHARHAVTLAPEKHHYTNLHASRGKASRFVFLTPTPHVSLHAISHYLSSTECIFVSLQQKLVNG